MHRFCKHPTNAIFSHQVVIMTTEEVIIAIKKVISGVVV